MKDLRADAKVRLDQIERACHELTIALESDGSAVGRYLAAQVSAVLGIARVFARGGK